ncbi:uncharacterized protein BXIN_0565 [Babesia sp. Xinjiang]|uniref:uncharacterized protein n=1 Tax=Babesia sp. Xinjiang TaxID=462227 RepID=UPI000A2545B4|nr:uncharacterized protein BXIN_0565 [Babesia sp. Xinjiang]ORM41862.1 hypothetical protein BXIN_0565 [Babesia sp. Xinjiang]
METGLLCRILALSVLIFTLLTNRHVQLSQGANINPRKNAFNRTAIDKTTTTHRCYREHLTRWNDIQYSHISKAAFVPARGNDGNFLYGRRPKVNRTEKGGCGTVTPKWDLSVYSNHDDEILEPYGDNVPLESGDNAFIHDEVRRTIQEIKTRGEPERTRVENSNLKKDDTITDDENDEDTYYVRKQGKTHEQELKTYEDLYSTLEQWRKSDKKGERDIYGFLQRRMKEMKKTSKSQYANAAEDMTVEDFIEEVKKQSKNREEKTTITYKWHEYIRMLKSGIADKIRQAKRSRCTNASDIVDRSYKILTREEQCGYRYPIAGSPEERYSDPNVYKAWGRTGLYQTQYLRTLPRAHGKVEQREQTLEELILSNSPKKDTDQMGRQLDEIRLNRLEKNMTQTDSNRQNSMDKVTQEKDQMVATTFSAKVDVNDTELEKQLIAGNRQTQLEMLLALNPYNPWDKYKRMKMVQTAIETHKTIEITYKLKSVGVKVNINDTTEKPNQQFLRDYLHHFLMLPEDHEIMQEFKNAQYLYDVLRYFDLFERETPKQEPEFLDLQDRLFNVIFPALKGFPKPPPNPEYPMTMTPDKKPKNFRVNAVNALLALLRAQELTTLYAADIFTEQRIKTILATIERALELEITRLKLGITDIQMPDLEAHLCQIDDAYLATLAATLSLWNIVDGVEGIVDAIIVLTNARIAEMRPKYLVATAVNIANIHKLPKSVFLKFVKAIVQQMQKRFQEDLVHCAVDTNHTKWMDFETAAQTLNLLARYNHAINKEFMNTFMKLYMKEFMELKVPEPDEIEQNISIQTGNTTEEHDDYWQCIRKADDEIMAERHRMDDELRYKLNRRMKVNAVRGRKIQYIWSLISCLSWCDLTQEYRYLVKKLNMASVVQDFKMHSMGALAVLQTCSQDTEEEQILVMRALAALMDVRWTLKGEQWLEAMEVYREATLPRENGKPPRIKTDSAFIVTMYNQFVKAKTPNPKILRRAVDILHGFHPNLSRKQLEQLFSQMCDEVTDYSYMQVQSLDAERLEYPLREVAHVLRMAAKSGVRLDKPWNSFLELLNIFKHTLTIEDIHETLFALKAANYTGLEQIGDLLICRACNIVEVMTDTDPKALCDIMELALSIKIPPAKLLRWYIYLKFHDIPESDMGRLAMEMLGQKREYDIDFRGWKRPVGHSIKGENIQLISNLTAPLKMHGAHPYMPNDKLKYVMLRTIKEPPPYTGDIRTREGAQLPEDIRQRMETVVAGLLQAGYTLTPSDLELFKMAKIMPKQTQDHTNEYDTIAQLAYKNSQEGDIDQG